MTSPAVTELPRPLEPVSRDTFLDDVAPAADRLDPTSRADATVRPPGLQIFTNS